MSSSWERVPTVDVSIGQHQHPVFAEDVILTDQALSEICLFQRPDYPQVGFYTDWGDKPREVEELEEAFSDIRARHVLNGSKFKQRVSSPDIDEFREWDESNKYTTTGPINPSIPPLSIGHLLQWVGVRAQSYITSLEQYYTSKNTRQEDRQDVDFVDIPVHLRSELARLFVLAEIRNVIPSSDASGEIDRVAYFDDNYCLIEYEPKDSDSTREMPLVPSEKVLNELGNAFKKIDILDRRFIELDCIHEGIIADREAARQQRVAEFISALKNPDDDSFDLV